MRARRSSVLADPLARAVHRRRQRACSRASLSAPTKSSLRRSGRRLREPDLAAALGERADDLDDLRVIAHRRADEADALRVRRG